MIRNKIYQEPPNFLMLKFPRFVYQERKKIDTQFNIPQKIESDNKIWILKSAICLREITDNRYSYYTLFRNNYDEYVFIDYKTKKINKLSLSNLEKNVCHDVQIAFYELEK